MLDIQKSITIKDGKPLVSSRMVAKVFEKQHNKVLRDIRELNVPENFKESNFGLVKYKDKKGERRPEYLMTRDGFTLLVMGYNGEKAMKFKVDYIEAFNNMEVFIKDRMKSKMEYSEMTAAIKAEHEEPKHYHFSNEADLINRIALGMTAKQIKIHRNIQDDKTRDYLTQEEIFFIRKLQNLNTILLEEHQDFQFRKAALKNYYNSLTRNRQAAFQTEKR